jgi:hypothetical protein
VNKDGLLPLVEILLEAETGKIEIVATDEEADADDPPAVVPLGTEQSGAASESSPSSFEDSGSTGDVPQETTLRAIGSQV